MERALPVIFICIVAITAAGIDFIAARNAHDDESYTLAAHVAARAGGLFGDSGTTVDTAPAEAPQVTELAPDAPLSSEGCQQGSGPKVCDVTQN